MIITDLSTSPTTNEIVNIKELALHKGPIRYLSILTTGTFTGTPKLEVSQDKVNFYPLYNEEGEQIELVANKIIYINFVDLYLRVDLTGVSSEDLKISIQ
ncbi:MAG: hypothetical protein IKP23_03265 [Elusimicrobiaceae bacterium]|nr:hypothetical protein [Elusimicrobiaceae bacterium]